MRRLFCLIGDPVSRSRSPAIHARAFAALGVDAVYAPCEVKAASLKEAVRGLKALGAAGFNVTVPHKRGVARLVDARAPSAERSGSVNCVVREEGRLVGHDTDGDGLLRALAARGVALRGAAAVVGVGGSGAAVATALAAAGAEVLLLNRTLRPAEELAAGLRARGHTASAAALREGEGLSAAAAAALARAAVVVHCTTVGMGSSELPFDPSLLAPGCALVDLVYAGAPGTPPGETALVQAARARGVAAVDGVDVLVHQAIGSLELWLSRPHASLAGLAPALRAAALEVA